MQEQERAKGSKKFLHWIHCLNKHMELYLEVALYYLLSSWWATEHSNDYLHIFWVSEVDSAACVGTMTTLPVVPGIAHLNTACRWSLWALVCADIQQDIIIDFPSPKLNIMLGLSFFHSLPQSLLLLYLRPVYFNVFILKTYLQGRQAALSVSCLMRSENTLKSSKDHLGFYYSTCVRAATSATGELMGCVAPHSSAQCWVSALHCLRVAQAILTCTEEQEHFVPCSLG